MKTVVTVCVDLMIESGDRRSWWVNLVNDRGQVISPSMFRESADYDARDRALIEADSWAAFHGLKMTPYEEDDIRYEPSMEMESYREDDAAAEATKTDTHETVPVLHVWRSTAMKRHVTGSVAAVAVDAPTARQILMDGFEESWRADNEYKFDADGSWADDDHRIEYETVRTMLKTDLSAEPLITDRMYLKGSE